METTEGGAIANSARVVYVYRITNNGTLPLSNVLVIDDLLGAVPGSPIPSLGAGVSVTLMTTATVTKATTNSVFVSGNNGQCTARATAIISQPSQPCPCELGYPFQSSNPRTSVVFNESEVLRAFSPNVANSNDTLKVWYNDEHALLLGVRRVIVKTASGSTTSDYPVTPLTVIPGSAPNPQVGTTALSGDQAGTDPAERPIFPALFITDITGNPSDRSGDWQFGGTPRPPHAVFGTWKSAVRIVDKTHATPVVSFKVDADPAKNDWSLGAGDAAPAGLKNEGYGAEARWNVADLIAQGIMQTGRVYRVQFMVHDGDQNKQGGDVGQGCATVGLGATVECPTPTNPPAAECTSGIVGFLVQYTGPTLNGPTTLTFSGSAAASATVTYNFPNGLTTGEVLSLAGESDVNRPWTIDASKHGTTKLGTKTSVAINGVLTEILHTSCSCRMNNFIPGQPACLDAGSPDNPTGTKGEPSPLFLVLDFK
jgi:hypothetical protein